MTTKVLIVNYGHASVEVVEMMKSAQAGYPDTPSPSLPRQIFPQSSDWFYVHNHGYLVVKEKQ